MHNFIRRFSFNHATFDPDVPFGTFVDVAAKSGAGGVGVWTERLDGMSAREAGGMIRDRGLSVSGVNRGGFFTGASVGDRRAAIDRTRREIDQTAELHADTLVIVPGGLSRQVRDIETARRMVREGIESVVDHARASHVRLAIEPFHPALSATRSVINTLDLALDLCEEIGEGVGVIFDIFHLWWDPGVYRAIERAGPKIFGHHLCDWKLDTDGPFTDRAVMGDGVADAARLTAAVLRTGYRGWLEIEIFSRDDLWTMDPQAISALCMDRAIRCVEKANQINSAENLTEAVF